MASGRKMEVTTILLPLKVMQFNEYVQRKLKNVHSYDAIDESLMESVQLCFSQPIGRHDLPWYRDANPLQKGQLRDFLIEFDRQNRVDPQNHRTKLIHEGVRQIMTNLTEKMEQLQPRLGGKLYGVGSSHNDTKVGEPDEFDFIYELNARTLLDDRSASTSARCREIKVCVPHLSDKKHLVDFLELYDTKSSDQFPLASISKYLVGDIREESNKLTFNSEHIAFAFFMILNGALQQLDLPKGWSHGGFDRPRFSGIRLRHPSHLIQLYYDGTETHEPLPVSVDFVPVLKVDHRIQQTNRQASVLDDYLQNMEGADWVHLAYHKTDPPLTWYEERLLSDYHFESAAKTVIRVFKVLCKEALCSVPHYVSKYSSVRCYLSKQNPKYADHRIRGPSDLSLEGLRDVGDRDDYSKFRMSEMHREHNYDYFDDNLVTGQDIWENLGNYDIVSSYVIKLAVMTLIVLDPNKGKSWTSNDIVDLVLSICLVFKRLLGESDLLGPHGKLNVSVPLKRYYKRPHNTETEITARLCPPKFYKEFCDALGRGNCWKLASMLASYKNGDRMDGILEVLRSACYGKSTAKFQIRCEYEKDTPTMYVKKADLKP